MAKTGTQITNLLNQTLPWWLLLLLVLTSKCELRVVLGAQGKTTSFNVTKLISFPEFSSFVTPGIEHEIRLLGSAKLSREFKSIQIPDTSELDDIRHQAGRVIYSSPIRMFDPDTRTAASFHTSFAFQLSNYSTPGSYFESSVQAQPQNHGGSGLTFLIAPDEFTVGRPGAWLGMLNDACNDDYYKFIAIEFDTRQNPEFGDPNDNHIGINLGSIVSSTTINASNYGLSFEDGSIHRAQISYDGVTKKMEIRVGSISSDELLTSVFANEVDLSPFLNEYMFVGFSASTGNRTQIHNILSWNFTSTSPAFLRFPSSETCENKILVGRTLGDNNNNNSYMGHIKEEGLSTTFLIFISVVALSLVILLNLYCNSKRSRSSSSGSAFLTLSEKQHRPRPPNRPRRFTVSELSLATRGFGDWEVIGSDSSGVLFKGTLSNGCHVAVKRFSTKYLGSLSMDRRRFLKRVGSLSRVRHPGLVPIRGWCYDTREYMVVYEHMFNGCLNKWLFGVGVLPWARRFKVVKNVANGLTFLHSRDLAHNNLQVASVFLDVSFKALLGDFGPSDPIGVDPVSSRSVDVFNFGVFVLEVVAGRTKRAVETGPREFGSDSDSGEMNMDEMDLLDYAWMVHESDEKIKMVDPRMGSGVDPDQAIRVIDIGLLCTLSENNGRPKMEEVVRYLNMEGPIPELPPNRPVVLFPYNSGPTLCGGYVCAPFKY